MRTSLVCSPPSIVARLGSSTAGIVGRACVAPETREVGRGAQFEQARLLAASDLDRLEEAGLSPPRFRLSPLQCDLPIDTAQVGEPKPLSGSLGKVEGFP
jgi:hypothetical protein